MHSQKIFIYEQTPYCTPEAFDVIYIYNLHLFPHKEVFMRNNRFNPDEYPLVFTPIKKLSCELCERELKLLKEELKHIKSGSLFIEYIRGKAYFIEYRNRQRQRITKHPNRVYGLARREYIKAV